MLAIHSRIQSHHSKMLFLMRKWSCLYWFYHKQCTHVPSYQNVPCKDLQTCPDKTELSKCYLQATTLTSDRVSRSQIGTCSFRPALPDNHGHYSDTLRSSLLSFPFWILEQSYELTRKTSMKLLVGQQPCPWLSCCVSHGGPVTCAVRFWCPLTCTAAFTGELWNNQEPPTMP